MMPGVHKIFPQKISRSGVTAIPGAKLGRGDRGWANFWPCDRGSAMTRATLSHGPLDQTLDSLALFRYKRFPLSIELSTRP